MFAIIRALKHKSVSSVARSGAHTFREQPTPNAAPDKTQDNLLSGCKDSKSLLAAMKARLPVSRRRDAVLCIEYLITASPEAFKRHGGFLDETGSGYFNDALVWLRKRHGVQNLICSAIHLDESTPHMIAYVVPITPDGRLSARDFLGGPKVMRELQDSFHAHCGQPQGLLRGIRGSKAHHSDITKFYAALSASKQAPQLTSKDYAAKALGYETKAWREANAVAVSQSRGLALKSAERKSALAKARALEQAEKNATTASRNMALKEEQLNHRERLLNEWEGQLANLKRELGLPNSYVKEIDQALNDKIYPQLEATAQPQRKRLPAKNTLAIRL